jgi:hypothetical protein
VCASAGCDAVFGLREVDPPEVDSLVDAKACSDVGHDEDGDGLDDGCDPCPFDVDNSGDDDHDGIALACDPDPTVANQVLLFAGFGPNTSQFVLSSANIETDAIHTITNATANNTYVTWTGLDAVDNVEVIARVHVRATLASATFREVGLMFDTRDVGASDREGLLCVLGKYTTQVPNDGLKIYRRSVFATGGTTDDLLEAQPSSIPLDAFDGTIRASYRRGASPELTCAFSQGNVAPAISASRQEPLPATGRLSLYVDDAETEWDYVFVVSK